jgi:hypothetical protein
VHGPDLLYFVELPPRLRTVGMAMYPQGPTSDFTKRHVILEWKVQIIQTDQACRAPLLTLGIVRKWSIKHRESTLFFS